MKAPILLLGFNRPDKTAEVFKALSSARPEKLYVACDGPRPDVSTDINNVRDVRSIMLSSRWPCELKSLFSDHNRGCKSAVSAAISWFFDNEAEGIIIEDDCLPHADFFSFCEELLPRYRHDPKVWCITGDNFQNKQTRGAGSYYFSKYNHIWGWASWRRCWANYDLHLSFWPFWRTTKEFKAVFSDDRERQYWAEIFQKTYEGAIDTWDYQWTAAAWRAGGLTATPQSNLVTNIGMGEHATHIKDPNARLAIPLASLSMPLIHPHEVIVNAEADRYVFENIFRGPDKKPDRLHSKLFKRICKLCQRLLECGAGRPARL